MRKQIAIVILLMSVLLPLQMRAQTPIVQMMEGEIRAGLTTPLGGYQGQLQNSVELLKTARV